MAPPISGIHTLMFSLLFASFVAHAEPNRCVATLQLPAEGCAVRGETTVTGVGRTEAAARKAASATLQTAVQKAVTALRISQPGVLERDLETCDERVKKAFVECFPEPALAEPQFCFVSLDDKDCWSGDVLTLEEVGLKVYDVGTAMMCKAVDDRLVAQNYTDVAVSRARCAASCARNVRVRCPTK